MHISDLGNMQRRAFLKRAAATLSVGVGAPLAMNLAAFGEAAAYDSSGYKALVCVFLAGGNDHGNTVIPFDVDNYGRYRALRGALALDRGTLAATTLKSNQTLTDNIQYALPPQMTQLKSLFDSGRCAVQLNVGPLMAPTSISQYNSGIAPLPPKLFSHNDQQSVWQSLGVEGSTVGWGGRLGDLALASNSTSQLTCISAAGNAVFLSGNNAYQYQISTGGAIPIKASRGALYGSATNAATLKALITQGSGHVLEEEFAKVTRRSINMEGVVTSALSKAVVGTSFDVNNADNPLANQLKIVARLIAARNILGVRRQVFFVSLGGFDTHGGLAKAHPTLLAQIDEAMGQFYKATVELGVANQVTAFTASDFGRTLTSNGDGSDHGWGAHHFVVGGAVKGGAFYGVAPRTSITSDDQVGQGRLLPSTSVDQFAANLARWFGVSNSEIASILPNIGRFDTARPSFLS